MVADLCLLAVVFTASYCVGAAASAQEPAGFGIARVRFGTMLKRHVMMQ